MSRPLDCAIGERLELSTYYADFADNYARAGEFWKLERGQDFTEPGSENWRAFDRGDWAESLRLSEDRRAELIESERQDAARGMTSRRVRIVALPLSAYVHWELYVLKIRDEAGEATRILLDHEVAALEDHGPLPDLNLMDNGVMYQVIYDDKGVIDHVIRYADKALVQRWQELIAELFQRGEPIGAFFKQQIAHLPPPRPARQPVRQGYLKHAVRVVRRHLALR